ncbi:MAG TPA: hybrid sensor histidine kinase/response regulator, partial [Verrucomicrobiales bacterium]|nr:hybrid sensor histidine kinase/response regulator [Verrucomicrobiales bacterium]
RAFPVKDASGETYRVVGVARDVSERKHTEDRLREQASLLDKARDAILVRDLDHGITYWNKGAEHLYGWTAEEALGRKASELLYRDISADEKAFETVIRQGEWRGEIQQVNRAGVPILIEARWTLVRDADGRPKSILAINTDITEKKRLEQQYLRVQRMESIGTLAGGIAHDLNNVLAPILMSIDLLRLTSRDERARSMLSTIETSARRGADMVQQILSFARGVEGQRVMINPRLIIEEIQHLVQDTFPKNILFQADLPADLPAFLGDHTQVHQILLNLCVNARDAMPGGGTLTVSARSVTLDEQYAAMHESAKPGDYIMIKVTDTGTGIPPEVLEKIFDPFFTTKEVGKGTGLGLSTVLAIIKSHDGFLNVYSEPNRGTTFSVWFPASGATTEGPGQLEEMHPRGRDELILVVDDEAAVRTITQQTLEAFGYRVLVAADGTEAVTLYTQHRTEVAAVLTDMMMPIMDGPATIQVLRHMNPALKIIAASGLSNDSSAARAAGMGVKHFLPKPYTAQTVLTTLRMTLDAGS